MNIYYAWKYLFIIWFFVIYFPRSTRENSFQSYLQRLDFISTLFYFYFIFYEEISIINRNHISNREYWCFIKHKEKAYIYFSVYN